MEEKEERRLNLRYGEMERGQGRGHETRDAEDVVKSGNGITGCGRQVDGAGIEEKLRCGDVRVGGD